MEILNYTSASPDDSAAASESEETSAGKVARGSVIRKWGGRNAFCGLMVWSSNLKPRTPGSSAPTRPERVRAWCGDGRSGCTRVVPAPAGGKGEGSLFRGGGPQLPASDGASRVWS